MPSTSKKQHNFMAAVANNPSFAKKVGVPQSVGQDFNKADKGRKFSKGGDTMASKMNAGFMAMIAKKKGEGPSAMGKPVMKKGMDMAKDGMKKMASGGMTSLAKHAAKPASKAHAGLKAGGMAKGGGIETKGKTKGKMIVMKSGGKAC
jgi:hypothetical protein